MAGVDKKSSDDTLKIIKNYTDVLFRFDFNDDFSEIRNKLIRKSSGDWILISDGHETWHNIEKIGDIFLSAPNEIDAFAFALRMSPSEGSGIGQQLRLFKNKSNVKYQGAVHNKLNVDDSKAMATDLVWIYHNRTEELKGQRYRQRKDMIEKKFLDILKDNPNDARANYYLGTYYLSQAADKDENGTISKNANIDPEFLKKAIRYIEKYISVSEFYEEIYLAKWYLAQAYYHIGDIETTKQIGLDMFEQMAEMPLAQQILGEIYLDVYKEDRNGRNLALAEFWFKNARNKKPPFVSCFFPEPFFTWLPWERLTEIYSIAQKINDAILCGETTIQYQDFPKSRRTELTKFINQWKSIRDGNGKSIDSGRSRDRQFNNVHAIDNGGDKTLSNKDRSPGISNVEVIRENIAA